MDIVHVVRNEFLLLGRTQTNEHNIRTACGVDAVNNLLRVGEIAVMRAGKHQSRILRTQVCTCLFGNTGLRTQQIQAHVLLGHRGNKALGKFNAGYLTMQFFHRGSSQHR